MKMNEKGALTVQFIFGFGLLFGFMMLLFVFSLTLTVAEIGQYVVYSASRNYMAAHVDKAYQEVIAENKFNSLKQRFVFFKDKNKAWFALDEGEPGCRDDVGVDKGAYLFCGFSARFNSKILNLNIPFFGSTYKDKKGMITRINSYLGRHPSTFECQMFRKNRWEAIIKNHPIISSHQFLKQTVSLYRDRDTYKSGDNGC